MELFKLDEKPQHHGYCKATPEDILEKAYELLISDVLPGSETEKIGSKIRHLFDNNSNITTDWREQNKGKTFFCAECEKKSALLEKYRALAEAAEAFLEEEKEAVFDFVPPYYAKLRSNLALATLDAIKEE